MNKVESILRRRTMDLFNDNWYVKTTDELLKESSSSFGYVYFIKNKSNGDFVKIGKTSNITNRMKSFRTSMGNELYLVGFIYTDKQDELEKELHIEFSDYRDVGEWFNLEYSALVKKIKKLNGVLVGGYWGKSSYAIDHKCFNVFSDIFNFEPYWDKFVNYLEKLPFNERHISNNIYNDFHKLSKLYSTTTKRKCTLMIQRWCKYKGYNYISYNSTGVRGFIIKK
jgi:hypothetical protein